MSATAVPVFDGHNDMLLRLWKARDFEGRAFLDSDGAGHIDRARAAAGGLTGGFFAVYPPDDAPPRPDDALNGQDDGGVVDHPPTGPVAPDHARRTTFGMAAILLRLARARPDALRVCRSVAEIEAAEANGAMAAVMHVEGAEAIGHDLLELETLHAAGLRSLGPVWSRPNIFATGVPFRFPGGPEEGAGLTDAGRALVRACDELGIMVDLSHMNAAGFRDVARISDRPLVATHSNAHALSPSSRNLTDAQLDAIAERGGVVGLNFAVGFLRADGRRVAATPLETMVRHLDHLLERLGEGGVALGSDFDGALIPEPMRDASGLPALVGAMRAAGYGERLVARICRDNWLDLLRRILPAG